MNRGDRDLLKRQNSGLNANQRKSRNKTVRTAMSGSVGQDVKVALDENDTAGFLLAKLNLTTVSTAGGDYDPIVAVRDPSDADSVTLYGLNDGSGTAVIDRVGVATISNYTTLAVTGFVTSGSNPTVTSVTNPHTITVANSDEVLLGENSGTAAWEILTVLGGGGAEILDGLVFDTIDEAVGYSSANGGEFTVTTTGGVTPIVKGTSPRTIGTEITDIEWSGSMPIKGTTANPITVKYHMEGTTAVIDSQDDPCGSQS